MYRSKDFLLMDVLNIKGQKIGYIKDLLINFNKGSVDGFVVSTYKFFQRDLYVLKGEIVTFNKAMIIGETMKDAKLEFGQLKHMDVLSGNGSIIGMLEDVLFEASSFSIKGMIVSTGYLRNFMTGKRVILIDKLILGEKNLLYIEEKSKVNLVSLPHKLVMEVDIYEEKV